MNEDRTKTHIALNLDAIINDKNHEDNILIHEHDIIRVLSIDDFDDEFFVSVFGAVRNTGEFRFGENDFTGSTFAGRRINSKSSGKQNRGESNNGWFFKQIKSNKSNS